MANMNDGGIVPGSRVRLRDADGTEKSLLIRRGDPESWAADSIASDTPLARALIGRRAGDEVEFKVHDAVPVCRLTVLSVDDAP